ncbi:MAG: PaaI family thioesterase, partial [Pseudomonadota bacterium]
RGGVADALAADGRMFTEWLQSQPGDLASLQKISSQLGLSPVELGPEGGCAKLQFSIDANFCNFLGQVHGGIVATLLDETAGLCACTLVGRGFRGTVSMHVDYLGPAKPGVLFSEGRLIKRASRLLFFETYLRSPSNDLLARGSSVVAYGPIRG